MTDDFLPDLPVMRLSDDANDWEYYDKLGDEGEKRFPKQDARNFFAMLNHNTPPDIAKAAVESGLSELDMVVQGYRDGDSWLWYASFNNGETWQVSAWCDYTGWDCQSNADWILQ